MSTRSQRESVGDDALRSATGHDGPEWFAKLDEAGAMAWGHAATARWIVDANGLDGWWAQGIAIRYEQERKGRLPGQQSDGSFAASASRTIAGDRLKALGAVVDAVTAEHGEASGENLAASQPNVRWRLDDGTRLMAAASAKRAAGWSITLSHERLPGADAVAPAKAAIVALLDGVAGRG